MMNRYHNFVHALTVLQAHWRGYTGRRIAFEVKRNKKAIVIQRYARGFVKRCVRPCKCIYLYCVASYNGCL